MKTYNINGVPTPISFTPSRHYLAARRAAERLLRTTRDDDERKARQLVEQLYPVADWLADLVSWPSESVYTTVEWTGRKIGRGDQQRGRIRAITYHNSGTWSDSERRWVDEGPVLTVVLPGWDMKLDGPLECPAPPAPAAQAGPRTVSINGVPVVLHQAWSKAAMALVRGQDPFASKRPLPSRYLTRGTIAVLPGAAA